MSNTNKFYNENAKQFHSETINLDMGNLYEPFLKEIKSGGYILDAGCGSGRDAKYFKSQGYKVEAFDASEEMCKLASIELGQEVKNLSFTELNYYQNYDGIWACASLLHLKRSELSDTFKLLAEALKPEGTMYCSFKLGDFEGERNGRYFTDMTLDKLKSFTQIAGFKIYRSWETSDIRPGRENEKWLNILLKL